MVRVANRGITTVIDARGAFGEVLGVDDRGSIDLAIPPALPPTFYAVYGEVIISLILLFVTLIWLIMTLPRISLTRSE
jgi:apolipoprotein N-acyltransferase